MTTQPARLIRRRVETVLGARVQQVAASDDGGLEVVTDERTYSADAVVVTTPPEVTQRLVPEGVLPDELGLGQSPIVNVHLVLDRPGHGSVSWRPS